MATWKRKKKLEKGMPVNESWWELIADALRGTDSYGEEIEKEKPVFKLQKRPRSYSSSVERPKPDPGTPDSGESPY